MAHHTNDFENMVVREYLSATPPAGVAASAVKACYQFDGSASKLTDRSGTGNTLTAGGAGYTHDVKLPLADISGLALSSEFLECAAPTGLNITGALTLEFLGALMNQSVQHLISYGGNTEDEANNNLYHWYKNGAEYTVSRFTCENGGGTDSTQGTLAPFPLHLPSYLAITRDASGNLNQYINGSLTDTGVAVTTPTGGSTSHLRIGSDDAETAADLGRFIVSAIRICNVEFTAQQVTDAYKQVRGL